MLDCIAPVSDLKKTPCESGKVCAELAEAVNGRFVSSFDVFFVFDNSPKPENCSKNTKKNWNSCGKNLEKEERVSDRFQ